MKRVGLALAVLVLAGGCASALSQGQSALRQGRFVEAEGYFNQALAADPGKPDALVGLGVAEFKQGQAEQAIDTLQKALAVRPNEPSVRLYLGLAYLRERESAKAEEQLTALRGLKIDSRFGRQIDGALEVIRKGPLSEAVRDFVIGSLETQAELSREAQEARAQAQLYPPYFYPYYPYPYPYFGAPFAPCILVNRGGFLSCI